MTARLHAAVRFRKTRPSMCAAAGTGGAGVHGVAGERVGYVITGRVLQAGTAARPRRCSSRKADRCVHRKRHYGPRCAIAVPVGAGDGSMARASGSGGGGTRIA